MSKDGNKPLVSSSGGPKKAAVKVVAPARVAEAEIQLLSSDKGVQAYMEALQREENPKVLLCGIEDLGRRSLRYTLRGPEDAIKALAERFGD